MLAWVLWAVAIGILSASLTALARAALYWRRAARDWRRISEQMEKVADERGELIQEQQTWIRRHAQGQTSAALQLLRLQQTSIRWPPPRDRKEWKQ